MSNTLMYSAASILTAASVVVMLLFHFNTGFVIGVVGILLTLVIFLVQETRQLRTPQRQIIFLGKSSSTFSANILAGLKDTVASAFPTDLHPVLPQQRHEKDDLTFQIHCLRRMEIQNADALVIVPAGHSDDLWNELSSLTARGVFVVVIDDKAPNRYFYEKNLRLPRFVSSDFATGGQLAASLIAEYLTEGTADLALVLTGPAMSTPGRIRSSACIYELTRRGLASRLFVDELESWAEEEAILKVNKIMAQIEHTQVFSPLRVCIYCANDANCRAIDEYIENHPEARRDREYFLIGYDGTRNPDGSLILGSSKRCIGTVDVLPGSQGRSAGTFLIQEHERSTSFQAKNALITPRLLRRPTWR